MSIILEIKNLHKDFGNINILNNINVTIEEGDFLVLVGPSGCGKSTLLNCIAGLEPVSKGSIAIDGKDMTVVSPKDRDIAMVFQSYALYPTMTVGQNITFGMKVRGIAKSERELKLSTVAKQLQIEPLLNRRPGQLSGGQRQRVAMGRALVRNPKLFLFDEPLSNLDAKLRVEMRTEIKKLHQNLNASMVYVTHDQIEAMTLATKIVVMKGGVVQQIGTPSEIYNHPQNLFVADFMGSPAMNLIPAKVEQNGKGAKFTISRSQGEPLILHDENTTNLPENVVLGLRPEDIGDAQLRKGENLQISACEVDVVEPAGADTYVIISLGGKEVTARIQAETAAKSGKEMLFTFNMEKVSYFNAQTGQRLN
ncbi:MAG: sn-glycerol-3-phosphate ABC transporter ATP-binding protein UgpC [Alphaproteobacteria bacterium]|nr:sn-glycerol-3-phosphate ABC transporter ATP-binding protein UgpC [Alphaproteobacteria bacterium]